MHIRYIWRTRIAWALAILAALTFTNLVGKSLDSTTRSSAATMGAIIALVTVWAVRWIFHAYEQHRRHGKVVIEFSTPNLTLIAKRLAIGAGTVYFGLVAFHVLSFGDLGSGFRMATSDVKVATTCPHKPATLVNFIARNQGDALNFGLNEFLGDNVPKDVCENW